MAIRAFEDLRADALTLRLATGEALDVRTFDVEERIASLFKIDIVAVSQNADIDFEAVVGQSAAFALHGIVGEAPSRSWTGVCRSLQQIRVEERGVSTYRVEIVPDLWLATQRRNYRMFQQLSELDIALEILDHWRVEPVLQIAGVYKKRKYRVQYGETDYAFFSRMLEEAGITHSFQEIGGATKLVISDEPQQAAPRGQRIVFVDDPGNATAAHRELVTAVKIGRQVKPGIYTVRDHDYRRHPAYKLAATATAKTTAVEQQLESFDYVPGAFLFESAKGEDTTYADDKGKHRTDEVLGARLTERRLEAARGDALVVGFETSAADLAPGVVFGMLGHPRRDLGDDQKLLIVASKYHGNVGEKWTHACEAVSASSSYRPPLCTPKPKVSGVESATVVGADGDEIHTDEFGRVRVHFHWDRESKMNDDSSCWIHVSQPWGGTGFGGSALPRVGQEVIVDFLGGDPDRPVIIGRVYTNLQKTPYQLPANKTQSGLKSNSTTGTGGYNELMFEDAAGRELVRVQAERDYNKLVKHDEVAIVGNDRTRTVVHDESLSIGNDRLKRVSKDEYVEIGVTRTKKIGKDEHVSIGADRSCTIGGNETATVTGNRAHEVSQNESVTVNKNRSKKVGQNELVKIGKSFLVSVAKSQLVKIGKSLAQTVKFSSSERVGLSKSFQVGQSMSTQVGLTHSVSAGKQTSMSVKPPLGGGPPTTVTMKKDKIVISTPGGASITLEGDTITLKGKTINLTAENKLTASAKEAALTGKSKVNVSSKGGEVAITGGPLVSINGPGKPAGRLGDPAPANIINGSATSQIGGPSLPFNAVILPNGDIKIGNNIILHGTPQFQSQAMARLGQIGATKSGMAMLNTINNGKFPVTIVETTAANSFAKPNSVLDAMPKGSILSDGKGNSWTGTGNGTGSTVEWNPNFTIQNGNGGPETINPDGILMHEMTHAMHNETGTANFNSLGSGWDTFEEQQTELTGHPSEADYLAETGNNFHRIDHDSTFVPNTPPPGGGH